jgi:hypothetical protein
MVIGNGLTDIAAERFDAGVARSYFASRSQTLTPQDLTARTCINLADLWASMPGSSRSAGTN